MRPPTASHRAFSIDPYGSRAIRPCGVQRLKLAALSCLRRIREHHRTTGVAAGNRYFGFLAEAAIVARRLPASPENALFAFSFFGFFTSLFDFCLSPLPMAGSF